MIEMTKHTPGPWKVDAIVTTLVRSPDRYAIADTDRNFREIEECEANAQLIAVSPRMLKALQKVAALYNPNRCAEDETARNIGLRMEMMEELHEEVMGIIRKAEPE